MIIIKCIKCGKESEDRSHNNTKLYCSKICQTRNTAIRHYRKRSKADPTWNARKQRKHRKKYPDNFTYTMARYYFRKLTPEKRNEIIIEVCGGVG